MTAPPRADGAACAVTRGERALLAASLAFLLLPNFVFAAGYLRPAVGLPIAALVLVGAVRGFAAVRRGARLAVDEAPRGRALRAGLAVAVVVLWTGLSGSGGIGYQNADHLAANAVLRDLVRQPWPLAYADAGAASGDTAPYVLVYYVGFYLPAAVVGRIAGLRAANLALFAWTLCGALLAVGWFIRLCDAPRRWWGAALAASLFALASGLDWLGWALCGGELPPWQSHVEWWAELFQLSSHSTLLLWVPQHAIAAWLATGTLLFCDLRGLPRDLVALVVAATAISTPFATLGLLPFLAVVVLRGAPRRASRDLWSAANLVAAPALLVPVGLFLASNTFAFAVEPIWQITGALPRLMLFLFLEVGVFAPFALWALRGKGSVRRAWLGAALVTLSAVCLVRVGHFSDLTMRASIPALFALFAVVAWSLFRLGEARSPAAVLLAALLATGGLTGLSELARSAAHYSIGQSWADGSGPRVVDVDIVDLARERRGDPSAFFWRHLARPPAVR